MHCTQFPLYGRIYVIHSPPMTTAIHQVHLAVKETPLSIMSIFQVYYRLSCTQCVHPKFIC